MMKKLLILFVMLGLFQQLLHGQNVFQKKIHKSTFPHTEEVADISLCNDSGYVMAINEFTTTGNLTIIKTNSIGEQVWTQSFNTNSNVSFYPYAVGEGVLGGYYWFGEGWINNDFAGYHLIKFDDLGDISWAKHFIISDDHTDRPAIVQKSDGSFLIIPADVRSAMMLLVDQFGTLQWGKRFNGDSYSNSSSSAILCSDNGYILNGRSDGDIFLIKTDSAGTTQWTKKYHNNAIYAEGGAIIQTQDGNYLTTGYLTQNSSGIVLSYIVKFDNNGNWLWGKTYRNLATYMGSSNVHFRFAFELTNGDIILSGWGYNFITRVDSAGSLIYAKALSDQNLLHTYISNIKVVENEELLVVGQVWESSNTSGFFSRTDVNGNFGCYTTDIPISVATISQTFTVTSPDSVSDFNSFTDFALLPLQSDFVTEDFCVSSVELINAQNFLTLYPNPATTTISIQYMVNSSWSVVNIYNTQGQLVSHPLSRGECASLSAGKGCVLDISQLTPGLYYLHLQSAEGAATKKFQIIR
jgi:hypothetical protein